MGIQKSFLRPIAFALLAASIIAKVHCLPKSNMDEQREQEMEGIRANILSRLGLTEPLDSGEPLTEDQEAIVAAFWDYQTDEKVKADMTTTKYTLVGQLRKQDSNTMETTMSVSTDQLGGYSILFELDELENITNYTITKAELLLFQDSYQHVSYRHIKVKVSSNGPTLIVNSIHDRLEQPGYKTFDITPIIAIWLKGGSNGPLVLELSAHCVDSPDCGKHIFDGGLREKSPKLVISRVVEETTSQQRLKRQVEKISMNKLDDDEYSGFNETLESNETSHDEHETTCSLHSLTVNFQRDLGLDFIIEPKSFNINYCLGTCNDHPSPIVYEFYRRLGPNSPVSSIQPHCAIHTAQSLDVLMKVGSQVVIELLKDVIVTSCGCA